VRITFDPAKRERTLRERGLDFEDAAAVFAWPTLTVPDRRRDYGEDRFNTFGILRGRMVVITWTPLAGDERRVISMRKCNAREQKALGQRLREDRRDDG
jgi:uncharacterized DUF497 family protein